MGDQAVGLGATTLNVEVSSASGVETVVESPADGVAVLHLTVAEPPTEDSPLLVSWRWPLARAHSYWQPRTDRASAVPVWFRPHDEIHAMRNAAVGALYTPADLNDLTYALGTSVQTVTIGAALEEQTADFIFSVRVTALGDATGSDRPNTVSLRLDARQIHFGQTLEDVGAWWAADLGESVLPVPDEARLPAYSTWYSMHQHLDAGSIEKQVVESAELGCGTVIVDDGWQTSDTSLKYAFCGDWEPDPEKFPDMRAHVARVHEAGSKYLLWYAIALVGVRSAAWERLKDKLLVYRDSHRAGVVDPRYPEVREYLAAACADRMQEWGLDGYKIDFVDSFVVPDAPIPAGVDCESVDTGAERLLDAIVTPLRDRPEVPLIEFRQDYVGPRMWRYGNLMRAADCPGDATTNRVRTVDLRLASGDRAVHADMIMWHRDTSPETAALQVLNVLFAAPQISVLVDQISAAHREMLGFWLGFARDHVDVLQCGHFRPSRPDLQYPVVRAHRDNESVVAVYDRSIVDLDSPATRVTYLVNASPASAVSVETTRPGPFALEVFDCRGRQVDQGEWSGGRIGVPASGLARLEYSGQP